MPSVLKYLLILLPSTLLAQPFCAQHTANSDLIVAYFGADSGWNIDSLNQEKLTTQLQKISMLNYSFIRFKENESHNIVLDPSIQYIENIKKLRQLNPKLPVSIAIGGWGGRDDFKVLLQDEDKMDIFVESVRDFLITYQLDGVDVDWENESLATVDEKNGLVSLLKKLHDRLNQEGFCITNAVPGTEAYWNDYPNPATWHAYVNWTTIMSYDHYGTFGPKTENAAALYEAPRKNDENYPYPTASVDIAVNYYLQNMPANKLILGLPFYCHSYYIKNDQIDTTNYPGLQSPVLDPNLSSQVSYETATSLYGDALFNHSVHTANHTTYYGLIPIPDTTSSRFMSCDNPSVIKDKIAYVHGHNNQQAKLGGVSFWSLQQDVPYESHWSLLKAINEAIQD